MVMRMKLRIRDLREDHDLAQKQVAALPLELAVKLADLYNVSLDYLVGREYSK